MFTEIANLLLEILKFAPRYFIAFGITAAFLLFGKESLLKQIGVYDFTQNYRQWVGLVFVVSIILFLVDRAVAIILWTRYKVVIAKTTKSRLQRLHRLTEEEKHILRFYIVNKTKTNVLRIDNGVAQGLVAAGIIYQAACIGSAIYGFAYNISDFAWEYLNKNNHLLEGTIENIH